MTPLTRGESRRIGRALWIAGALTALFVLTIVLTPAGRRLGAGPVIPGEGEPAAVALTPVDDAGMHEAPVTPQSDGGGPAGQTARIP